MSYVEATVLTPTQQHLLKMFAYNDSEERMSEVLDVLTKHFSHKLDEQLDLLWDAGILNQEKLDSLRGKDVSQLLKK